MNAVMVADRAATEPSMPERYRDDGRTLYAFLFAGCDVSCPSCGARGRVDYRQEDKPWRWSARFRCGRCAFAADALDSAWYDRRPLSADMPWFGPVSATGSRACGACGHKWVRLERRFAHAPSHRPAAMETTCARCGHTQPVAAQWWADADVARGIEPFFGLSLAWREPCRNGREIWAFGPSHLAELKRYVLSTLRERDCAHNRSYFMRLPAWIKSAKHRGDVLAAIGRIEKRMRGEAG